MGSPSPLQWTIGLVGYGEVGRILAEDLRARGVANIVVYDIKQGGPDGAPLRRSQASWTSAVVWSVWLRRSPRMRCWASRCSSA